MSNWLGVVSAAHVRRGVALGIAQINHGKRGPLTRMRAGDLLIYYSPVERFADREPLRAFTALGIVADDDIWQADEGDFRPFRRRVEYEQTKAVPLAEIRDTLHLTAQPNWGYQLRRGLVELDNHDAQALHGIMTS